MNNLPKVVTQQRRGRASNPRLLDHKSDALPLSHRVCAVKFVKSLVTRQHPFDAVAKPIDVDANILPYPAHLSMFYSIGQNVVI